MRAAALALVVLAACGGQSRPPPTLVRSPPPPDVIGTPPVIVAPGPASTEDGSRVLVVTASMSAGELRFARPASRDLVSVGDLPLPSTIKLWRRGNGFVASYPIQIGYAGLTTVVSFDLDAGAIAWRRHLGVLADLGMSPDGSRLWTVGHDGLVLRRAEDGRRVTTLPSPDHRARIDGLRDHLVVTTPDTVRSYAWADGGNACNLALPVAQSGEVITTAGWRSTIAVGRALEHQVHLVDTATCATTTLAGQLIGVFGDVLVRRTGGSYTVFGTELVATDLRSGTETKLTIGASLVTVSPDGRFALVHAYDGASPPRLADLAGGQVVELAVAALPAQRGASIFWAPEAQLAFLFTDTEMIRIDLDDGAVAAVPRPSPGAPIALDPSGRWMVFDWPPDPTLLDLTNGAVTVLGRSTKATD